MSTEREELLEAKFERFFFRVRGADRVTRDIAIKTPIELCAACLQVEFLTADSARASVVPTSCTE